MAAPGFAPGGADLSGADAYRMSMDHLGLGPYNPALDGTYHAHHQHPHSHPHAQAHAQQQQQQQHHQHHHHQPHPQHFPRLPSQARPPPQTHDHQHQHHHDGGGQFGILAPTNVPQDAFGNAIPTTLESTTALPSQAADTGHASHGPLSTKIVFDPPDLAAWREKLFNVDDLIILTDEQFETYFPHVDNVYSHRSTQRYKRKPFVSHYWDCRMKGRPSGTPKSDDPNKKKRKRNAREKDLCDVKIKITEYSPGAQIQVEDGMGSFSAQQVISVPDMIGPGQKFWTIQRVNGNGGNGKGDGVAGPHRHSLAASDAIKKNSIQRELAKLEKQTKQAQASQGPFITTKASSRKASGAAAVTIKKHSKASDLIFYAAPWCPFSHRVWITLEALGMPYQFNLCGGDGNPTKFCEISPEAVTPAIKHGEFTCRDSEVIVEYLEDLDPSKGLFPENPQLKAKCRLWMKHVERKIIPTFFAVLKANEAGDLDTRSNSVSNLRTEFDKMALVADEVGPFFFGSHLSLVDIFIAPFALRLSRLIAPLCGWDFTFPMVPRWQIWLEALETNTHVKATMSDNSLYADPTMILLDRLLPDKMTT